MAGCVSAFAATSMKRVALIPSGPDATAQGLVLLCDSDHDSLQELIFQTGTIHPYDPLRIEMWEHQGWNHFGLVFADTGEYPRPPGITTGNAIPFAAGDVDGDGLTDVVCINAEPDSINPDIEYDIVMVLESPDYFSYPVSLCWCYRCGNNFLIPFPTYYPPDLDTDGHKEIFSVTPSMGACIWENTGDNQNELVWRDTTAVLTFGDFDLDGRMNFASASLGTSGAMRVWECTGDDQYEVVYQDTVWQPNGADLFTTGDIDGDGKPEFYIGYRNGPDCKMYLYIWEMVGDDNYSRTLVDSVWFAGTDWGRISESGDIDGDGIDECIWTTPDVIKMYKAFGDNDLREVWHWYSDHGELRSLVSKVYDVNGDGYSELVTAGSKKISIFEVDAVDLVSPNSGTYGVGDTVSIRWVTRSPPRCDSLSLLLRRDSLWNLDTIARGLPATDTLYRWVVPATVPDTGRVVVIAYGPGWQYDISNSVIDFTGGGASEGPRNVPLQWFLSVSPNPARCAFSVRYDVPGLAKAGTVPRSARTRGTVPVFALGIYDAGGRLVQALTDGEFAPGHYEARLPAGALPAGIYFIRLDTPGFRSVRKVVVTR